MLAPVDLIMQRMNYMPDAFSINVFRIYGIYNLLFLFSYIAKDGLSWNDYLKMSILFAFTPIERLIPCIKYIYY